MDSDYELELAKADIREAVRQKIGMSDGIFIIGPVTIDAEGNVTCAIRVDERRKNVLPERLQIAFSGGGKEISLRVEVGPRIRPFNLCPGEIAGQVDVPDSGFDRDISGGSACWPAGAPDQYGTIAIAAAEITIRSSPNNFVNLKNACLTAGHVFGAAPVKGDYFSAPGLPDKMIFEGNLVLDPNNALPNVDAGLAKIPDPGDYATGRIKGFRRFKTEKVRRPTTGGWITAVGAKSGVTIGFDDGSCDMWDDRGYFYKGLRQATPGVSCCHDSGAPVMDVDGYLIGMIVGGEHVECRLRPYSYYVPFRPWNTAGDPSRIHDLEVMIENR